MRRGHATTAELDGDRGDEEATVPECFEVFGRERAVAIVVEGAGRELLGVALGIGDHRRAGFRRGVQLRARDERGRRLSAAWSTVAAERWREGCRGAA